MHGAPAPFADLLHSFPRKIWVHDGRGCVGANSGGVNETNTARPRCERLQVRVTSGCFGLQWEQRYRMGGERGSPQRMRTHVLRALAGYGHLSLT
jgi:hypothetical protein